MALLVLRVLVVLVVLVHAAARSRNCIITHYATIWVISRTFPARKAEICRFWRLGQAWALLTVFVLFFSPLLAPGFRFSFYGTGTTKTTTTLHPAGADRANQAKRRPEWQLAGLGSDVAGHGSAAAKGGNEYGEMQMVVCLPWNSLDLLTSHDAEETSSSASSQLSPPPPNLVVHDGVLLRVIVTCAEYGVEYLVETAPLGEAPWPKWARHLQSRRACWVQHSYPLPVGRTCCQLPARLGDLPLDERCNQAGTGSRDDRGRRVDDGDLVAPSSPWLTSLAGVRFH